MHIWGRAHRVRRRGGLGVTSPRDTPAATPRSEGEARRAARWCGEARLQVLAQV